MSLIKLMLSGSASCLRNRHLNLVTHWTTSPVSTQPLSVPHRSWADEVWQEPNSVPPQAAIRYHPVWSYTANESPALPLGWGPSDLLTSTPNILYSRNGNSQVIRNCSIADEIRLIQIIDLDTFRDAYLWHFTPGICSHCCQTVTQFSIRLKKSNL